MSGAIPGTGIQGSRIADIVEGSGGLAGAHVAKAVFGPEFLAQRDIAGILRSIATDPRHLARIRAYTEVAQRPDLARAVFGNPPPDDDLEQWGRWIFGGARFGIVLDRPPLVDDALAARLGSALAAIYQLAGAPAGGAEPHIFLGDYGYSPFGAHHDTESGRILHFHLGPGVKTMHIWDDDSYAEATGGRLACFDPRPILHRATAYLLEPGDVLVLPTEGFHVGHTPEFSVGFAVCLLDASPRDLARRAAEQALAGALEGFAQDLCAPDADPLAGAAPLVLDIAAAGRLDRARAVSNLHLVPESERRGRPLPEGRKLGRVGVFPLVYDAADSAAVLAGRGHGLELPASAALEAAVRRLNAGEALAADGLVALLAEGFDADAARFLVTTLWDWRALGLV